MDSAEGGVDCAIEVFEWSRFMLDLTSVEQEKGLASQLARRIETYQKVYPGRPVHLLGVSAGTGLVVWALEDLAPPTSVSTLRRWCGARATTAAMSRHKCTSYKPAGHRAILV